MTMQRAVEMALTKTKSCENVVVKSQSFSYSDKESMYWKDEGDLLQQHLLLDLLPTMSKSTNDATNSASGSGKSKGKGNVHRPIRDRCDSMPMDCWGVKSPEKMIPKPKPVEIKINLDAIMPPVEESESDEPVSVAPAAAAAAKGLVV